MGAGVSSVGLTLEQYAEAKKLPWDFLGAELGLRTRTLYGKPAVAIPYRDQDGGELAVRYRVSIDGANPFRWPQGTKAKGLVYGLENRKPAVARGCALLVEGESDVQTALHLGLIAFGIPGVGNFDDELTSPALEGIDLVYIQEPGEAAKQLREELRRSRLREQLRVTSLGEHKDVSALHLALRDEDATRARLEAAIAAAVPLDTPKAADESAPVDQRDPLGPVRIVPLDTFADTPEDGEEAVLGDRDNAVIPEDGDVMFYGDGGAGKTTLVVDLAMHLAAGDDWLCICVPRPLRVLIVENEGPRARFRRKLRRKRDAWQGSRVDDRVAVLEAPWAAFSFGNEGWRDVVADYALANELDVLIVGPVASAGMDRAGTLQEVREFLALVADVRRRSGRRLVVILVHHEAKGGKVSGAWEGAGDTLVHVSKKAHGRMRLEWQKTRWASDYHATSLTLLWSEGDSFTIEEKEELDDHAAAERIVEAIAERAGTTWGPVEKATKGIARDRRNALRDELLRVGRIVNVRRGKKGEPDVVENRLEQGSKACLYVADHDDVQLLRSFSGAAEKSSPPTGGRPPDNFSAPLAPRGGEAAGGEVDDGSFGLFAPAEEELERLAELARETEASDDRHKGDGQ